MSKIKIIGNGFIQVDEALINLNAYKKVQKHNFGYDEDPEGNSAYGLILTPLIASEESIENGVDGSFFITTYTMDEVRSFEEDFELMNSALKDSE